MLKLDDRMNDLAGRVIGAAIEVHRILGPGYLESIYEEALSVELSLRGVSFVRQMPFEVRYKGMVVGSGRPQGDRILPWPDFELQGGHA